MVAPFVKALTDLVTRHTGYVVSYTKHVNNLNSKIRLLDDKSTYATCRMESNFESNLKIPAGLFDWLDEVERLKEECESILTESNGCLNIKMRYMTGRKVFKIVEMIEDLLRFESKFIWTDALKPLGRIESKLEPSTTSTPLFPSREKAFNEALKFLQQDDNNCQVIALCGQGGVGKTTMMEELKKVAKYQKMFDVIVTVCIGRNPNIVDIQNIIALSFGHSLPEMTVTSRADRLFKIFKNNLENQRKILVILDDVWEVIELENIGLTSPLPNGVKLLLTSRFSFVCEKIASDAGLDLKLVKIERLEEGEAYNLLSQVTGRVSEEDDHEVHQLLSDTSKKCHGLPDAIAFIGKTLKNQDIYEWTQTLQSLNDDEIGHDQRIEVLKYSYNNISKNEGREIFLLCSLFPADFDIPIEDLTRLAWGLNLFEGVSTLKDARHCTRTCVQELINRNLLSGSHNHGYFKMDDLVLDFVLGMVRKGNHPWVINHDHKINLDGDEMKEHCKRISLSCKGMSEFRRDFKYPNLSLIQLMDGDHSLKFQNDFYNHMKNLQVITYYNMQDPLPPRSLQNLKTLCLHKCRLMSDYSFLGDLVNLEVLSLAGCGIRKLTSTMVGNLKRLKLLDLTGCVDLHIEDGVLSCLTNLEELYIRVSDGKAIRFTDTNLDDLKKMLSKQLFALEVEFVETKTLLKDVSFKNLEKFKISMGCLLDEEQDNDKFSFKNTIKIVTQSTSDVLGCKIYELFFKTEKLYLQVEDMILLQNVSHGPYQKHSFFNLRDFEVFNCVKLKYLFPISVATGLRNLERLTVSSCFDLEALVCDKGGETKAKVELEEALVCDKGGETKAKVELKLRFMSLKELPKLVSLFQDDCVVELPKLVELEVDGLPNFTSIFHGTKNKSSLLNSQVGILKLNTLRIKSMENLKHIWTVSSDQEEEVSEISTLREIEVGKCDSLVNLFPTNPMRLLTHLEELTVRNCGSIEVIFNVDLNCIGREVSNSSLRVIEVYGLEHLREVWRIETGEYNYNSKIWFGGVESIRIGGCKMFRNVFTPTDANFYMGASSNISIYDCGERGKNKEPEIHVITSIAAPKVVEDNLDVITSVATSEVAEDNFDVASNFVEPEIIEDNVDVMTSMAAPKLVEDKFDGASNSVEPEIVDDSINVQMSMSAPSLTDIVRNNDISRNQISSNVVKQRTKLRHRPVSLMSKESYITKPHLYADCRFHSGERYNDNINVITSVAASEVAEDNFNDVSLSSIRIPSFSNQISKLDLGNSPLKVVFEVSNIIATTQAQTPLFPYLKDLRLSNMERMTHVWNGYNSSILLNQSSFNNLTTIYLYQCKKIKYLFSPLMAKLLNKLKQIHLDACDAMEQVVSNSDEEITTIASTSTSTPIFFPDLRSLKFHFLRSLKGIIGAGGVHDEFKVSQVSVVCSSLFRHCRDIHISWCDGLSEIFETILETQGNNDEGSGGIHNAVFLKIQNTNVPQLSNLMKLVITHCGLLQHVFTFSMLESLQLLQELEIKECQAMEVIVKKENEEQRKVVEFPNLKSLELSDLQNLEGFFLGTNSFEWPSLEKVMISRCPQMVVFTCGHSNASKLNHIYSSLGKHSLDCGLNFILTTDRHQTSSPRSGSSSLEERLRCFHNLIELRMPSNYDHNIKSAIPFNELQQLQKLEMIQMEWCFHVKEVFEVETVKGENIHAIPNLKQMEFSNLEDLKYIWMGDTVVLKFPNLTTLFIDHCDKLEYVFTSAMVDSLQQLQDLHISNCAKMEVIIKKGHDAEEKKIITLPCLKLPCLKLPCLKSLKLEELQSLKGFWLGKEDISCPLLRTSEIKECPQMRDLFPKGHSATRALNVTDISS